MSAVWTMTINGGAAQTLAALGVTRCTVSKRNMAISEMRFSVKVSDIYSAIPIAYGNTIRLLRDSTYWFVGTVTALPATGSGDNEEQSYVVSDAWYKLERIIYQQYYVFRSDDFTKFLGGLSSHVTLGRDAWGNNLTPAQVIAAIGTFANVATVSVLDTPTNMPLIEARDISCAEAIKRMVALTPDCVGWFDYSSGNAVLKIRRRPNLSVVNFDLTGQTKLEVIGDLGPRNDLLVNGVVLVFLTTAIDTDNKTWILETRQTAGSTSGEGVIFATISLSAQGTQQPEAPPASVASDYYATLTTLQWQGSLVLKEEECSGTMFMGSKINLLNGRAGWGSMNAVVQGTTEDLVQGTTEVELGPPNHLSAEDFVGLMGKFRKLPPPSNFPSTQNNGTEGVPVIDGGPGADPDHTPVPNPDAGGPNFVGVFPYVDVEYCKDGVARILRAIGIDIGAV